MDADGDSLKKDSGRKGARLSSLQEASRELGQIHPDKVRDGEVKALLVKQSEYEEFLDEKDYFPSKKLTQGVKSGVTNRYEVEFGYQIDGRAGQYMVIPNTDDFKVSMKEAQKIIDQKHDHIRPIDYTERIEEIGDYKCLNPECDTDRHKIDSEIGQKHLKMTVDRMVSKKGLRPEALPIE